MFDSDLSIQAASATTWRVIAPLIWTGSEGDTFTVPVGFVTDFATVPRFMHWLVLPYGPYTRAAVLHDFLLTQLAEWQAATDGGAVMGWEPSADSHDTDGIFRRAMKDLGVGYAKRWLMWAGVRWGALFSSRRAYGREFAKDAPKVIGVSLLALPVIIWGAVGVLISLGIVRVITWKRPHAHLPRRGGPGRVTSKGSKP